MSKSLSAPVRAPLFVRRFTREGDDPFTTVPWSNTRTAQIIAANGDVIFKQENVEAPLTWSDTAVNIAASKYFCKQEDSTRESSVRHMIARVVNLACNWGIEQGYFGNTAVDGDTGYCEAQEQMEIFRDELIYMLVTQRAVFNSPVWFNFGSVGHQPQSSACFILGVEDCIESILDTARDEAMIFKHGSGAGMNLGKLRSSRESLSSGGHASGPVAFMHGYDSWAGVIKSGGKTRRAALMLELDSDHGDIKPFVQCKADEELKAHMLIEMAGLVEAFEMLDDGALDTAVMALVHEYDGTLNANLLPTISFLVDLRNHSALPRRLVEFIRSKNWHSFSDNEAYNTVGLQNMNISVFTSDAFMAKACGDDPDGRWFLLARTPAPIDYGLYAGDYVVVAQGTLYQGEDGNQYIMPTDELNGRVFAVVDVVNARDLLHTIAEAAHICGDPGMMFSDRMNEWFTASHAGTIRGTNPCGEVTLPDGTSCNLASLNLAMFIGADGKFLIEDFRHTAALMATAQDMIIDSSVYPTEEIAQNTRHYRALGLGVANVGTILMLAGLPYDSDDGRSYVAAILSLLTATAYEQSAKLATALGAFKHYREASMAPVLAKHLQAIDKLADETTYTLIDTFAIIAVAQAAWKAALNGLRKDGYRNGAATCCAPTGTTGFMMDCDTTGIEPDIALIKYKNLAGRGLIKLVTSAVPLALERLGYSDEQRAELLEYLDKHGHFMGSSLKAFHLPVFDCAIAAPGCDRIISPDGHLKMLASAQPMISMSISKTVNLPATATVEEIMETYVKAWRWGLKAVSLYRDGSKQIQPMRTSLVKEGDHFATVDLMPWRELAAQKGLRNGKSRKRLPDTRPSITHKFDIQGHEGYIIVGLYEDTGMPGEVFIKMSKQGSTLAGVMDSFSISVSIGLQYGVPLKVLIDKFVHSRFEPAGWTGNKEIPMAKSVVDYIFRWLAGRFLSADEAREYGVRIPLDEEDAAVETVEADFSAVELSVAKKFGIDLEHPTLDAMYGTSAGTSSDAPPCPTCGTIMVRKGSCYCCPNCGSTTGCS